MNMQSFLTKPKSLCWALLAAGIALSNSALATGAAPAVHGNELLNQWAQMVVYAVTPYCQVLTNGLRVCQPIGLVGPAPTSTAAAYQPLMQVPLAPPSVQPPAMQPLAFPPHGVNPLLYGQAMPFLPWQGLPAPPTPPAAAPDARSMATAARPSNVQPPAELTAPPSPGQMKLGPQAQQPTAASADSAAAQTVPAASDVTASSPPAEPASVAAPAAAKAAIAYFEFDRAELTEAGRAALDAWLARNSKASKVVVTGHADRLGPASYNMVLSRRRAEAVRDYLVRKGIQRRLITIVAKGEKLPVTHCKGGPSPATIACLAPNRRVVVAP